MFIIVLIIRGSNGSCIIPEAFPAVVFKVPVAKLNVALVIFKTMWVNWCVKLRLTFSEVLLNPVVVGAYNRLIF